MFLCQKFQSKTKGGSDASPTEVAVVTLDPNPGTDGRFLTGSLTLSFLSGNTALQVRSSSSWRSRTGRTQLDRSIWTERESRRQEVGAETLRSAAVWSESRPVACWYL